MSSDFKLQVLSLCRDMTDEEFQTLIFRFDALNCEAERFVALLSYLNPYLKNPIEEVETKAEGLCEGCANPCPEKTEGKIRCDDYSELIEDKCFRCYYWDVNTCQYAGTCTRGEHFDPLPPEELKKVMPVDV